MEFPEVEAKQISQFEQFALEFENNGANGSVGHLRYPVIGEVLMRPTELGETDLTEKLQCAEVKVITKVVRDPGFIDIEKRPKTKEIRPSLPEEKLR